MRDGYYLSAYLNVDALSNLTGSWPRHDHNVSLWKKTSNRIQLMHYWELERISGEKRHHRSLLDLDHARRLLNGLLETYQLSLEDMVEVWGTPDISTTNDYHSVDIFELSYHSIAHLFSSLFVDSDKFYNDTIIGLAVDGGPDGILDKHNKYWYAGCVVQHGNLSVFPVASPGWLWGRAANLFRMEEGSLMALASASLSKVYLRLEDILCQDRKSVEAAEHILDKFILDVKRLTPKDAGHTFNGFDPLFSQSENVISMVMKEVQASSVRVMVRNITSILEKHNIDAHGACLALSGGYALNCPSNSSLMNQFGFKTFLSVPVVNDGGQSLGIALYAFYKKMPDHRLTFRFDSPYLGDSDDTAPSLVVGSDYARYVENVSDLDFAQIIEDLQQSPIVWFNGRAEIGPRALGNRSILGDPRQQATKDVLNEIKQRQWWRPVAPVVAEEAITDWFEEARPSPYMLETFRIRPERLSFIPAVAHRDGSARVQTVNAMQNPLLHELITTFARETGVPLLCNTSLNDKSEPIINTVEEGINFCLRKKVKVAYFNSKRVCFSGHERFLMDRPAPRRDSFFESGTMEDQKRLLAALNPFGLSARCINMYYESPELHVKYNLQCERDARVVARIAERYFAEVDSVLD